MPANLQLILLSLTDATPIGQQTLLVRLRFQDRNDVAKAAKALGMTQAGFSRMILVNAARKVLAETGHK